MSEQPSQRQQVDSLVDGLMVSASQLVQPSRSAADEFSRLVDTLAEEHNARLEQRSDLDRLIGPGNLAMMKDNSRNFCRFMNSMFRVYQPGVMVNTVLWVFRAYRSHGFTTLYWPAHLDTFVSIANARLTFQTFEELYPFFNWLIVNIPTFVTVSSSQLGSGIDRIPEHGDGLA